MPNTEFGHLLMHDQASETLVSGVARERRGLKWKEWASEFNEYLAMLEFFFWPDRIILGGGVSKRSDKYWEYLQTNAELVKARYLNTSGIIGAAYAAGLAAHEEAAAKPPPRSRATRRRASAAAAPPRSAADGRAAGRTAGVQIHLLDATYELFRAHFGRPPRAGLDGEPVGATLGVVESVLSLLREDGVTHLGCATDHVIRSWRNDRYPGYKTDEGMPPELLAPVRAGRGGAAGARRGGLADGRVRGRRRPGCRGRTLRRPPRRRARGHPLARQGHGPVRARATAAWSPSTGARARFYDAAGVEEKFGVRAGLDPRLPGPGRRRRRRLPRAARAGARARPRPCCSATRISRTSPTRSAPGT